MRRIAADLALFLFFWTTTASAANPMKAIVFPLDCQSKIGSLSWLSEGIAVSISGQLRIPGIQVVERDERIGLVESFDLPPGAVLSRASMISVSQRASADLAVMGTFTGTAQSLKISAKVLDLKSMKFSGDIVANGPLTALPQMENELAWLILANHNLEKGFSRSNFYERTRKVPNASYAFFIQSLGVQNEAGRLGLLSKAVEAYGNFAEAQLQLGRLYYQRGNCHEALQHLALGRGEENSRLQSDFMMGTCYLQEGQPDQAIQSLSRVLSFYRSFEALNNQGVAYLRKGDYTLALQNLLEARNLVRTDPTASLNLAILRHLLGNDSAARAILEETAKANPENGMVQFAIAFLFKSQGDSEKAAAALGKARNLGVNVDKLQVEDPKTWVQVLYTFGNRKIS